MGYMGMMMMMRVDQKCNAMVFQPRLSSIPSPGYSCPWVEKPLHCIFGPLSSSSSLLLLFCVRHSLPHIGCHSMYDNFFVVLTVRGVTHIIGATDNIIII